MKNYMFYLVACVFFVIRLSVAVNGEDFEGGKKVSKGDNLEVSTTNGNITVNIWNKDEVFVKAKNIDVEDVKDISFKQTGNIVSFKFKGQNSNQFKMEISIPEYMILDFSTGGGNITLKDKVNGSVGVSTGGGNVTMSDIGNVLSISTGGGNVSVGTVTDKAEISTGGGEVKVASALKKLEISTGGGNISVGSIGSNAEISTGGGNISIGNVSGSVEISSGGGNIKLDGANGKVDVSTGGGNIKLRNINGSVDVSSGSGSIEVEIDPQIGSDSEISTGNGNITLYISESAKTTVKANFLTWKHSGDKNPLVHLKSDFDGVTYDTNEIKKEMNALLKLNGGGSTIELNVSSGEIFIKKK